MTSVRFTAASAARTLADALRPVVDFMYPPRCPACGENIGAQTGLCLACWSSLRTPEDEPPAGATVRVAAAATYCDLSRKLILAFKHGGKIALAPLLARLIAAQLGEPQPLRLIIPVPLHPMRLWRRGYNQSALLGRELERLGHGRLLVDGLRRVRATPSLDKRSRSERAALLAGAIRFHPRRLPVLRGADVLLVDDVLTSGATTAECASALRQAGAASVTIACFAKVTAGRPEHRSDRPAQRMPQPKTNARDLAIPGVP